MYETPGGTILLHAHRAIESITLDKGEAHLKDELLPKYAEIIYNGLWFSSERFALQKLIDSTQTKVNGEVRVKLFKGNTIIIGRRSNNSLYDTSLVSFDEIGEYNQKDAEGFIKINSIRLKKIFNIMVLVMINDYLQSIKNKKKFPDHQVIVGDIKKQAFHS